MSGLPRRRTDDAGTTLTELLVGMSVMAVFLAMATGAIITLVRTQTRAQAVTTSTAQLSAAYQRLDRSVRYASAISTPGQANGAWWVELKTKGALSTDPTTCTQLRVSTATQQLAARSWTVASDGSGTVTGPTAWTPWASFVTNGGVAASSTSPPPPFVLDPAPPKSRLEQLTVNLVAVQGGNQPVTSSSAQVFAALNSAAAATAARNGTATPVCTEVARS